MILVVGATGLVGGEVCRLLNSEGTPVRALVRADSDPSVVRRLRDAGVELVRGDLRDSDSLKQACRGMTGIVCTASSMPLDYRAGINDLATVDLAGLRHLIDAAIATGTRRFIYTSLSGHIDRPFPLRDAKRTVEGWLIESSLDWTILRPSYFMETWLSPGAGFDPANGSVTIYGTGKAPISYISERDVAAFAVAALAGITTSRATLELGGPRPIAPLEVVRLFESMLSRTSALSFVPITTLDDHVAAATDPMQRSLSALMRGYADGDAIDMGTTSRMLSRPMTTVESYAAMTMWRVPVG